MKWVSCEDETELRKHPELFEHAASVDWDLWDELGYGPAEAALDGTTLTVRSVDGNWEWKYDTETMDRMD